MDSRSLVWSMITLQYGLCFWEEGSCYEVSFNFMNLVTDFPMARLTLWTAVSDTTKQRSCVYSPNVK